MRDLPGFRITEILYEDEYCFRCRACREADDRLVLLKVVRNASTADRAGLKHEYEIAADFGSPWIKQPLELENFDDAVVLVAADEGEKPLRQILCDGPLPMRQTLRIAADLAAALVDLHRVRLLHEPGRILDQGCGLLSGAPACPGQQAGRRDGPVDRGRSARSGHAVPDLVVAQQGAVRLGDRVCVHALGLLRHGQRSRRQGVRPRGPLVPGQRLS